MGNLVNPTQEIRAFSHNTNPPRNDALAEQAARVTLCYLCNRQYIAQQGTPDRICNPCLIKVQDANTEDFRSLFISATYKGEEDVNPVRDDDDDESCCFSCDNEDVANEAPDKVNNNPPIASVEQETFWEKHAPGLSVLGLITLLILLIAIIALV